MLPGVAAAGSELGTISECFWGHRVLSLAGEGLAESPPGGPVAVQSQIPPPEVTLPPTPVSGAGAGRQGDSQPACLSANVPPLPPELCPQPPALSTLESGGSEAHSNSHSLSAGSAVCAKRGAPPNLAGNTLKAPQPHTAEVTQACCSAQVPRRKPSQS